MRSSKSGAIKCFLNGRIRMHSQIQKYKGFTIKAYASPVQGGFIPNATVRRLEDPTKEFEVQPPSVVFITADAATNDALAWGKDLVDGLEEDFKRGKLH
jgi:hypothetical protein